MPCGAMFNRVPAFPGWLLSYLWGRRPIPGNWAHRNGIETAPSFHQKGGIVGVAHPGCMGQGLLR